MTHEQRVAVKKVEVEAYRKYDFQELSKEDIDYIKSLPGYEGMKSTGWENFYRVDLKTVWFTVRL